jgi:hypothetical protein
MLQFGASTIESSIMILGASFDDSYWFIVQETGCCGQGTLTEAEGSVQLTSSLR